MASMKSLAYAVNDIDTATEIVMRKTIVFNMYAFFDLMVIPSLKNLIFLNKTIEVSQAPR